MTGKIFLSYRREDTAGFALALFGRLEQSFSAESLFMDVEGGIGAGQDFVRVIEEQVGACDAMLVLIGPDWLTVKDEAGRRRLDNPEDFVRLEVGSALRFGRRVIPVLVQRTEMPRADVLPQALKALTRCNAVGLTHERFKADAQGLIKALERALAEVQEAKHKSETERAAAEKLRAAEEAAKAEAAARAVRNAAIKGLSPELIDKAEEIANWDFIKASERLEDFRDHLARFPQGVSERWARARLESLVWTRVPRPVDMDALNDFLAEFPNGANSSEANAKLAELETQGAPAHTAEGREKRNMDPDASANAAVSESSFSERLARSLFSLNRVEGTGAALGDESIRTFRHANWVWALAFSPDGGSALSGSLDHTAKLWDVATGREIRTFAGHAGMVFSVAVSSDGRTALSGSDDKTLKLWDVATGSEIHTFAGHIAPVMTVAFFPDGRARCPAVTTIPSSCGTLRRERKYARLRDIPSPSFRPHSRPTGKAFCPAATTIPSSCGTLRRERRFALSPGIAIRSVRSRSRLTRAQDCPAATIRPSSSGTLPRERRFALSLGMAMGSVRSRSRLTRAQGCPVATIRPSSFGTFGRAEWSGLSSGTRVRSVVSFSRPTDAARFLAVTTGPSSSGT
jgi:TIR domain/WD domain, G-beta repeat